MPAARNSRLRPALLIAMRWVSPLTIRQAAAICAKLVTRSNEKRTRDVLNELRMDGLVHRVGPDSYDLR